MPITTFMSCSIIRIVSPSSFFRRDTNAVKSAVSCGFIPAVGSSRSSSFGSVASARATSSRRWSPYGRFRASWSSRPRRLEKASSSRARLRAAASSRRIPGVRMIERTMPPFSRQCMPTRTFSSAVMCWKRRMFWNVRPIPSSVIACGGLPVTSVPANTIRPAVGL